MPNIVYVLTNETMPGIAKIGMTEKSNVQARMRDLYATGVPLPFECSIAWDIVDLSAQEVEAALYKAFGPSRVNPSREFFAIESEQAEAILRLLPGQDVTPRRLQQDSEIEPDDLNAVASYVTRRNKTNESEFIESLNESGKRIYSPVIALGARSEMQIKWGVTGFSLNVKSRRGPVVGCYGYPMGAYSQALYTAFDSVHGKGRVPQTVVDELRSKALNTSLFEAVGQIGNLRFRTDREMDDSQIDALMNWLNEVAQSIRESDSDEPDAG